jgi:hypothetical protein
MERQRNAGLPTPDFGSLHPGYVPTAAPHHFILLMYQSWICSPFQCSTPEKRLA